MSAPALYRHVLEWILSFSSLSELRATHAVSKLWLAAVSSMPSIQAAVVIPESMPPHLRPSALGHHVSSFTFDQKHAECDDNDPRRVIADFADADLLCTVSDAFPRLQSLHCRLPFSEPDAFSGFPHLRSLHFKVFAEDSATAAQLNTLLIAISAQLPHLRELRMDFSVLDPALCFRPLSSLRCLTNLWLVWDALEPTPLHIDELRLLTTLERLTMKLHFPIADMLRAPQPFSALQEMQLSVRKLLFTDSFATILADVPSLTTLCADVRQCSDASAACFRRLPLLTTLDLNLPTLRMCTLTRSTLFESLRHCPQITSLALSSWEKRREEDQRTFVEDLAALLPCFRCLKRFKLACFYEDLTSLTFLTAESVIASLEELSVVGVSFYAPWSPLGELKHLRILNLFCNDSLIGATEMVAAFTPPSTTLPRLTKFNYATGASS